MIKYFRKNEKKMLAIFSVGLMIVFALPSYFKNKSPKDITVGHVGKTPITAYDREQARREVGMLAHMPAPGMDRRMPVSLLDMILGREISQQLQQKPETFLLLIKEAQRLGIQVSEERLGSFLQNGLGGMWQTGDEDQDNLRRQAISDLLLVLNSLERAAGAIKISQPLLMNDLASQGQQLRVKLVEYLAKDYTGKVPQPTNEQLQKQFDEFKNTPPGQADAKGNPFGFGYKLPDRVKLEYVELPREEVVKAVRAKKPTYDWDVDVNKYYQQHQSEFPTTQPDPLSSGLTLGPLPSLSVRPATGPSTRPLNDVRDQIMDKLIKPEADRLVSTIQDRINTTLASDYAAYRKSAGATTGPTTGAAAKAAPPSSLGVPYSGYDYLTKLAAKIQNEFHVLPSTHRIADEYKSEQELDRLAGIGKADIGTSHFSTYLMQHVVPFAKPAEGEKSLNVFEPSPALKDVLGNSYTFRVTDAQAAAPPPDKTAVLQQVEQDWKTAEAYKLAKAEAETNLNAARQMPEAGSESKLQRVAAAAGKKVIPAGPLQAGTLQIAGYPLPEKAAKTLVDHTTELLADATQTNPHPLGLVELPAATRVLVVELDEVTPVWTADTVAVASEQALTQLQQKLATPLYRRWFEPTAVARRVDYRTEGGAPAQDVAPPSPSYPLGG